MKNLDKLEKEKGKSVEEVFFEMEEFTIGDSLRAKEQNNRKEDK